MEDLNSIISHFHLIELHRMLHVKNGSIHSLSVQVHRTFTK